jgi:hypothetical protein
MIFRTAHTFLECMRACFNSIFLGGINKVYAHLVGSDLGSG